MILLSAIVPLAIVLVMYRSIFRHKSWDRHKAALRKAVFVWLMSSMPWILGLLFKIPDLNTDTSILKQFGSDFLANFTVGEMFVYAASFLAPVVYLAIDAILFVQNDGREERTLEDYREQLKGVETAVFVAFFMLLVTAFSFASAKTGEQELSYFSLLFGGHPFAVYVVSLLLWYAVTLAEVDPGSLPSAKKKNSAQSLSDKLKGRTGIGSYGE